jgi:hypothetical protein
MASVHLLIYHKIIELTIHGLILATKLHKGAQRKKDNEKFLEVRKPFFKKVFGRRRQKLRIAAVFVLINNKIHGIQGFAKIPDFIMEVWG